MTSWWVNDHQLIKVLSSKANDGKVNKYDYATYCWGKAIHRLGHMTLIPHVWNEFYKKVYSHNGGRVELHGIMPKRKYNKVKQVFRRMACFRSLEWSKQHYEDSNHILQNKVKFPVLTVICRVTADRTISVTIHSLCFLDTSHLISEHDRNSAW